MTVCQVRQLGLVPYQEAWDLQARLASEIALRQTPPTLLLLEHPHTITFGRRGNAANLLWSEDQLSQQGVQVFWVDRGGDVTYHGPGQLVGYPLLLLDEGEQKVGDAAGSTYLPRGDYIAYLHKLEQVLINTLIKFGISAGRIKDLTGVWVNGSKIAAIGVKVDAHGVSRHGFALNVDPDMAYWDSIIGCGLNGFTTTSMTRLLQNPPPMQEVIQAVVGAFEEVFEVECQWVT